MSKAKILLSIVLSALVLVGLLAAFVNPASAVDKTAITFWTLSTRQTALEEIIRDFNAANDDVQVVASFFDIDGIKDAKKVAASSGTLPSMWFNWGGSLGGFYSDNYLTYDLTDYAKANDWDNIFLPGALQLVTRNGQVTGFPTSLNILGMYYRKDVFERLGLSEPTTMEELEAVCDALIADGITPMASGGLYGWHIMRYVEQIIEYYAGAELHDKMNTFQESYDNETVVKALTKYKEFVDKRYFPLGFVTASPNDTRMAVVTGMAAMDLQGPWYDGQLLQDGMDLNNFGTFAFPSGGTNRLSAFAEMMQFNKNLSDVELEAAMRFAHYYYSDNSVARFPEYYNLPIPMQGQPMPEGMPNVANLFALSDANGTFTITDQAFPTEICDALFAVQDAIALDQMEPAEGAMRIQAAIEAYLENQ